MSSCAFRSSTALPSEPAKAFGSALCTSVPRATFDKKSVTDRHLFFAKVRKELLEVPGVASANIDFEKDRALNVATVEYDADVVDAEALVAKVTAIGDGMYPVHRMEVTRYGQVDVRP